jgi:putative FmdB family regulatory protein|tara:strand:+ start:840 stop:1082 length:243 start_codon:yes stop_codon:yes gene_type:complete
MPRYDYRCLECLSIFTVRHSIKEKVTECRECKSEGMIEKIPTSFMSIKKREVGNVVKRHIEESKQDLAQEKQDLQNQEYK